MNEIKRIHLGRQPFVIAIDAYKALQEYLHAIRAAVGEATAKEVIEEVELRMAELLTEKGVTSDKAILLGDIAYLQAQLGNPGDFAETGDEAVAELRDQADESSAKRLFRDTQHGMIAGVSSGLAAYLGIDAVIVRLLFVLAVALGGWGIPLYLLLWIIVPEAKTGSEKLQMHGKAVTVDSLKEVVDRADVPGAARRASRTVSPFMEKLGLIIVVLIGIGFLVAGLFTLLGGTVGASYALLYQEDIFSFGDFGLSARDVIFGGAIFGAIASVGAGLSMVGVSMVRRKWSTPGWVTGGLLAAFFVSCAVIAALAPGVVNKMQRYADEQRHTTTTKLEQYTQLEILGGRDDDGSGVDISFTYKQSDTHKVVYNYVGEPNLKEIKTKVSEGKLTLDARSFDNDFNCRWFCIFSGHELTVTIYAPQLTDIRMDSGSLSVDEGVTQSTMTINPGKHGWIGFIGTAADNATVTAMNGTSTTELTLTNLRPEPGNPSGTFSVSNSSVTLSQLNSLSLSTNRTCSDMTQPSYTAGEGEVPFYSNAIVWLEAMPAEIVINGTQIKDEAQLRSLQAQGDPLANRFRCINIESQQY